MCTLCIQHREKKTILHGFQYSWIPDFLVYAQYPREINHLSLRKDLCSRLAFKPFHAVLASRTYGIQQCCQKVLHLINPAMDTNIIHIIFSATQTHLHDYQDACSGELQKTWLISNRTTMVSLTRSQSFRNSS